jgi:hypothetical protein
MPRWLSAVLVVVASILAFAALLAIWVNRQVLDTDNWAQASGEMLEIPAVRSRTAAYLADRAYVQSDIEGRIEAALPPRAQPLAAPAAGFLRDRLERRATEALARPDVQQLWEDANRAAHARLIEALDTDGPVTLDLHRMLEAVERRAGIGGRAAGAVPEGAAKAERGWRALVVTTPMDFSVTGVAAALTAPLAQAGVSVLPVATYVTDYFLVQDERLADAIEALLAAGHQVTA